MNDKAPRRNEGYEDLRDLLERFEEMGEVAHVNGADWNLEVGAVSEMTAAARPGSYGAQNGKRRQRRR